MTWPRRVVSLVTVDRSGRRLLACSHAHTDQRLADPCPDRPRRRRVAAALRPRRTGAGRLARVQARVQSGVAFLSGSDLRRRVGRSPLIDAHVSAAHQLLPIAAVFGIAMAAFVFVDLLKRARAQQLNRVEAVVLARTGPLKNDSSAGSLTWASRATAAVLVVMAIATAVAVVRVGDTGAKAVWSGRLNTAVQGK
jgi:hypothetical protein